MNSSLDPLGRAAFCALIGLAACARPAPEVPKGPAPMPTASPMPASPPNVLAPAVDPNPEATTKARDLVAAMTLEEKIAALVDIWDESGKKTPEQLCGDAPLGAASFGRLGLHRTPADTARFVQAARTCARAASRIGIPPFIIDEGVHGLMQEWATSFPSALALASTWDPELVRRIFASVAAEARARGTNWILSPVLDLARDPRWGRTDETFGEDPWLVSRMGVSAIRGLQGDGWFVDGSHVLATAKHFAAHGQPESGTNAGPANYSERILREEFLAPFEAAVTEAHVGAVMASYNEIDGVPSHVNPWLLGRVLRGEWMFSGFVTSDGGGISELVKIHHVAETNAEAAVRSMASGVDFELGDTFKNLVTEVRAGRLSEEVLNNAVVRVLRAKIRLGLFTEPPLDPAKAERLANAPEHRALALAAAQEAAVLLKNDNLLPLLRERVHTIAVIGPNAAKVHLGSYSVDPHRGTSLLEGIQKAVTPGTVVRYAKGCNITREDLTWEGWWKNAVEVPDPAADRKLIEEAVKTVRGSDVAVVAVGENEAVSREGWGAEHLGDRDTLDLLGAQNELVRALVATKVPVVVVLINGRPLAAGEAIAGARAAIEAFYLGQETGTALAGILFGDIDPSGRLPITIPRSVGQLPVYYYRRPSARRGYVLSSPDPLYPFGFGLSYTTFSHSAPTVSPAKIAQDAVAHVSVRVTNTGKRRGTDVVELYVTDRVASVTRPIRRLRDFARVDLAPGESKDVVFEVSTDDFELWDAEMHRRVEPGWFDLGLGTSSGSGQLQTVGVEVVP